MYKRDSSRLSGPEEDVIVHELFGWTKSLQSMKAQAKTELQVEYLIFKF